MGNSTGSLVFSDPHVVGIWTLDQTLVTSVDFPMGNAARLVGNFRYLEISPVTLLPGHTYVIAAFYPYPVNDLVQVAEEGQWIPFITGSLVTVDSRITLDGYRAMQAETLQFPDGFVPGKRGAFGPNFIVVPEPSVSALVAAGIVIALGTGMRQRPPKPDPARLIAGSK